jgi:CPA2 family monovalent cation:H+ antiporter-2
LALTKALLIIAAVLLVARRIMPKVLEMVAKTLFAGAFSAFGHRHLFRHGVLTSLAGCQSFARRFSGGFAGERKPFQPARVGRNSAFADFIQRDVFRSVGMLLDLNFLVMNLPLVLGAIAVVLIIKILTTGISLSALGYKLPVAASVALMLAQIGEFSFVLERAGREVGLTPMGWGAAGSQTFIAATVVLMVATPFLMKIGDSLSSKIESKSEQKFA